MITANVIYLTVTYMLYTIMKDRKTGVNDKMIKAVVTKTPRPDVKYEVADGSHIPYMGEKTFAAFTDGGVLRSMTAQVTEVNKALLSVAKLVSTGHKCPSRIEAPKLKHRIGFHRPQVLPQI